VSLLVTICIIAGLAVVFVSVEWEGVSNLIAMSIIAGLVAGLLTGWSSDSLIVCSLIATVVVLSRPKARVTFSTFIVAASFVFITAGITRLVRFGPNYQPDPTAKHIRMPGLFR
jgi:hypothetical protein